MCLGFLFMLVMFHCIANLINNIGKGLYSRKVEMHSGILPNEDVATVDIRRTTR